MNQLSSISRIKVPLNNIYISEAIIKEMKKLEIQDQCLFMDQIFWVPSVQKRHDTIGMNFGLEVRPPFLDHELVSLINSLPAEFKFNLRKRKMLVYQALNKLSKFKPSNKKYGTPSYVEQIISNKKEMSQFFESFRYGILNDYFNFNVFKKKLEINKKNLTNITIIFWRLYMINELVK